MRTDSLRVIAPLLAGLLLSGCASRLYERETLRLDHAELDRFEIRYDIFDGCLMRQQVPVTYRVKRALYAMTLDVRFGNGPDDAALDLALDGGGAIEARFPGLVDTPRQTDTESGPRYRLQGTALGTTLDVEVLRDGVLIGQEVFRIEPQRCRALGLGASG